MPPGDGLIDDTKNEVEHGDSVFDYSPFEAALSFVRETIMSIIALGIHWQYLLAQSTNLW